MGSGTGELVKSEKEDHEPVAIAQAERFPTAWNKRGIAGRPIGTRGLGHICQLWQQR